MHTKRHLRASRNNMEHKTHIIRNTRWGQIPTTIIYDTRLTGNDRSVALVLWERPETWVYHAEEVAKSIGLNEGTVKKSMRALESLGYIIRRKHRNESGQIIGTDVELIDNPKHVAHKCENTSGEKTSVCEPAHINIIHLNNPSSLLNNNNTSPQTPQGAYATTGENKLTLVAAEEASSFTAEKENDGNTTKPLSPHNPGTPLPQADGFDEFWKAYPKCDRKVGKAKCLEIWKRDKLCRVKAKVMKAIESDKKSDTWTKDNGKWIPLPTTWLNRKRHEDIEDEDIETKTAPTEAPNQWAVLTWDDIEDQTRCKEWEAWRHTKSGHPPSWSLKSEKWLKENENSVVEVENI